MKKTLLLLTILFMVFSQEACKTTKEEDIKLAHSFIKSVKSEDFDSGELGKNLDAKTRQHLIGKWNMLINDNGTYRVIKDGRYLISGDYTIKGKTISFTDMGGSAACLGDNMLVGEYTVTIEETMVSFSAIHDDCPNRKFIIAGKPWVIVE